MVVLSGIKRTDAFLMGSVAMKCVSCALSCVVINMAINCCGQTSEGAELPMQLEFPPDNNVIKCALDGAVTLRTSEAYTMLSFNERKTLEEMLRLNRSVRSGVVSDVASAVRSMLSIASKGSLPGSAKHSAVPERWKSYVSDGVRVGDLAVALFDGPFAATFLGANTREKRFTHVGVVVREGEKPEIVTADAELGDLLNPGVGRMSLDDFYADSLDGAVYRPLDRVAKGADIARAVLQMSGIPFDAAFDLKTKDRLYCAEMVRDAVNAAAGREVIGTSRKGDFEYVAIDDCYRNGFVKVFDAREWTPPVQPERADAAASSPARPKIKTSGSPSARPPRIRIIPMHPTKGCSR